VGFKAYYNYASLNSLSDKLNQPQAIAYKPYRQSRCIIPASGFVEGQDKRYHQLTPQDSAIAFGGLYQAWQHQQSGEIVHSASIITLPGHPKFEHIHRKSLPLMLPLDNAPLLDAWLDPEFSHVSSFEPFLQPHLHHDFIATPIDKPSKRQTIGMIEHIAAD
jgi:putative SOS response-associated peptidase YedK